MFSPSSAPRTVRTERDDRQPRVRRPSRSRRKLATKRDVSGLVKALGYEKEEAVRQAAAEALGKIGDA